jgi:hypothetical protein
MHWGAQRFCSQNLPSRLVVRAKSIAGTAAPKGFQCRQKQNTSIHIFHPFNISSILISIKVSHEILAFFLTKFFGFFFVGVAYPRQGYCV